MVIVVAVLPSDEHRRIGGYLLAVGLKQRQVAKVYDALDSQCARQVPSQTLAVAGAHVFVAGYESQPAAGP